jgi:hypothetical protein
VGELSRRPAAFDVDSVGYVGSTHSAVTSAQQSGVGGVLVEVRELSPREVLALDTNVAVVERDGLAADRAGDALDGHSPLQ